MGRPCSSWIMAVNLKRAPPSGNAGISASAALSHTAITSSSAWELSGRLHGMRTQCVAMRVELVWMPVDGGSSSGLSRARSFKNKGLNRRTRRPDPSGERRLSGL
jgi:hypothetical protein